MNGIGYGVGIAAILAKCRSFPLISVHLSRALGWVVAVNGGGLDGFGGDIGGFGGPLRGFCGSDVGEFGVVFGCGHWDGSGDVAAGQI